jgi:hypothetical protein
MKKFKLSLIAASMALATAANAETFQFGDLLSGTVVPEGTFATLTVSDTTSATAINYTLTSNNLADLFNSSGAFIGSMANNLTTDPALPTVSNITGGGVTVVDADPGGAPNINNTWEFRFDFGSGQDRLGSNETVSWTATFDNPVTYEGDKFALHVQSIGLNQGDSAWYVPTPIPEPQTYAMMLAGLGLLGFARIRRQKRDNKQ